MRPHNIAAALLIAMFATHADANSRMQDSPRICDLNTSETACASRTNPGAGWTWLCGADRKLTIQGLTIVPIAPGASLNSTDGTKVRVPNDMKLHEIAAFSPRCDCAYGEEAYHYDSGTDKDEITTTSTLNSKAIPRASACFAEQTKFATTTEVCPKNGSLIELVPRDSADPTELVHWSGSKNVCELPFEPPCPYGYKFSYALNTCTAQTTTTTKSTETFKIGGRGKYTVEMGHYDGPMWVSGKGWEQGTYVYLELYQGEQYRWGVNVEHTQSGGADATEVLCVDTEGDYHPYISTTSLCDARSSSTGETFAGSGNGPSWARCWVESSDSYMGFSGTEPDSLWSCPSSVLGAKEKWPDRLAFKDVKSVSLHSWPSSVPTSCNLNKTTNKYSGYCCLNKHGHLVPPNAGRCLSVRTGAKYIHGEQYLTQAQKDKAPAFFGQNAPTPSPTASDITWSKVSRYNPTTTPKTITGFNPKKITDTFASIAWCNDTTPTGSTSTTPHGTAPRSCEPPPTPPRVFAMTVDGDTVCPVGWTKSGSNCETYATRIRTITPTTKVDPTCSGSQTRHIIRANGVQLGYACVAGSGSGSITRTITYYPNRTRLTHGTFHQVLCQTQTNPTRYGYTFSRTTGTKANCYDNTLGNWEDTKNKTALVDTLGCRVGGLNVDTGLCGGKTTTSAANLPKLDHDNDNTTDSCSPSMAHCPCTYATGKTLGEDEDCPDEDGKAATVSARHLVTLATPPKDVEPIVRAEVMTTTGGQTTTEYVEYGTQ